MYKTDLSCPLYIITHDKYMHNQTSNKLLLNPMSLFSCMLSHHVPSLWNCSGRFWIFLCSACFDQFSVDKRHLWNHYKIILHYDCAWSQQCGITQPLYTCKEKHLFFILHTQIHAHPYTLKPMHSHTKKCCAVHICFSFSFSGFSSQLCNTNRKLRQQTGEKTTYTIC